MVSLSNHAASSLPEHYQGRIVHPALHFDDEVAALGILENPQTGWIITSDRLLIPVSSPGSLVLHPPPLIYGDLANRWQMADVAVFLGGDPAPSFTHTLSTIRYWIEHYVELRQTEEATLIACWTLGTYFYPLFPAYPRLHLLGERESGKSKLLLLISLFAFNGLLRLNPTPASLFRLINPIRPTLCLDEIESLATEERKDILSIMNSGYKANGAVDRVSGQNYDQIKTFHVYSPIANAGIAGLNATTESRCITILMTQGTTKDKVNREVITSDPAFAEVRNRCYRHALTHFRDVKHSFETVELPDWLTGRHRELYKPLIAMAHLADQEAGEGWVNSLLALARKGLADRRAYSLETEAILADLRLHLANSESVRLRPADIARNVGLELETRVSAEKVGQVLRRFGFDRQRNQKGTQYVITRARLEALTAPLEAA